LRNIGGVSQNPTTLLCIWVKSSPSSHVHWFTLSFLRHLSSSCLSKSFSLLHSRCHWLPLAVKKSASREKNATKVQKSTRRRNRVLTQIHLIYSVIRAASNEHSNEIPLPGRGRSAALENICAPSTWTAIQLLSRGIPPLSPPDSAAFHPNWPPASALLTSPPDFQQSPFLAVRFNESSQTRELGGDYQFSDVEKDQADTYLLIMKNVSAFSQSDCHLPLVLPLPSPTYPKKLEFWPFFCCRQKIALRSRFWGFRIGERLKNMINFKCTIKATILIMYR